MSRGPIPTRALTQDELTIARALTASSMRYPAGSPDQRFARTVAHVVSRPAPQLSARQCAYLVTLCIRMRRQIPADVLAIAERLSAWGHKRGLRAVAILAIAAAAGAQSIAARTARLTPPSDSARAS